MANPEPIVNGNGAVSDGMTAAERLMKQHAAHDAHPVTVEEVDDEDMLKHPAPSAAASLPISRDPSRVATPSADGPISTKAAGKQPAREEPDTTASTTKPRLDISEDSFPALGVSKAKAPAAPSPWSSKPAAVGKAGNGIVNGTTTGKPASSNASSRPSTPISGIVTPGSTAPSQGGNLSLPGRFTDKYTIPKARMTPRNQLKKPVSDIIRDVNKRSKAKVEIKEGPIDHVTLIGSGPPSDVRSAFKDIAAQLCGRQNLQIPVPSSVRGKIVGKQGATVQAISKRTGARINISKQEAAEILEDEDMDTMVDVTIEGDVFAVEQAKKDIEAIVNEHTSRVNSKLKHIPAEFYPFLASRQNAVMNALQQQDRELKMQIPQYHTWKEQAPPQAPPSGQPVQFIPQSGLPIYLSGDRQAVADAKAEIERQVAELRNQLTLEHMALERGRHQFILGEMGTSLENFLADTGCSIILPPEDDESEMITIVGPADRIAEAGDKVLELATTMQGMKAEMPKQFSNAPRGVKAHARDLARYFRQREAMHEIERTYNARILPQEDGSWMIWAREGKNALKARQEVINMISGHPPTRFQPVDVDPFYHAHLRERAASQIREQHGVRVIVPDDEESPVLLVFEDRAPSPEYQIPRKQPSAQEVQGFQQALQEAQQQILNLMNGHQEIVSREVKAPAKFHDKIRRHIDRHHSDLPNQIPVRVNYSAPQQHGQKTEPASTVNLRGPQDFVDALSASLLAFIEQEMKDELERGFTLTFDFPQKFANHLIGRRGENINRLREEFDVDIQLHDGKCEIKGPEAKANACKKHILDMARKLEDEVTHHLNIPPQYHKDLIGAKGEQVRRLQTRYNVRIDFPRTKQMEDDSSEAGDAAPRRHQAPNEVIVKGPSRGADACRDELLSLLQYVKDHSFTASVSVAQSQLPSLIGTGGKEMEAMRLETGAQIDVPNSKDAVGPDGRVQISIKGSKADVEAAKRIIEAKSKTFDDTVTRNLEVDRKHHRFIIGPQGSTLRNMIIQAGGPDESRLHNRMVRFPKTDVEGNTIRVEGQKAVVDKICAAIEALVAQQQSQTTEIVEVNPDKHRLLIGRGGETRRQLEQQFKVSINVPRQTETGLARSQVKIAGQPSDVEKAKAHILEITKEQEGETVLVPRSLHHAIADNGQFFRRLRNDHKVTVDHAGQRPPPKPSTPTPTRSNKNGGGGSSMPLITDDPSATTHSWEVHDLHPSAEEGEIPWVLAGPSPEAIQAARAKLDKALADAKNQDSIGFLILPDPRAYRHVVGPGGSEINRIRKQTGTKIQVPRDQNKGEAIEIVGSKDGVEAARACILEVVGNNS